MPGTGAVFSSDGSQTNSRTLVPSAAAARATSARPESVASISAPACLRMKAASSGLSMKLIGTSTAPSRASAKRKPAKAWRIARQDGDPRTFADAARGKAGGQAIAQRSEFRVAPGGVAADDGGLVGKALGAAMQQIRQRLAAKRGVHVISPQCFYAVDYAQVIRPSARRLPWPRIAVRRTASRSLSSGRPLRAGPVGSPDVAIFVTFPLT